MGFVAARPAVGLHVRVRDDLGISLRPLFALLVGGRLPFYLLLSLLKKVELSRLLPLLDIGRSVPGGTPSIARPASTGDRSPHPGPSGRRLRSSAAADRSRVGFGGHLSPPPPPPLGEADDDHSSTLDALDIDRDDSFQSVLALIRSFHSMEEPAGVPSARCKLLLLRSMG